MFLSGWSLSFKNTEKWTYCKTFCSRISISFFKILCKKFFFWLLNEDRWFHFNSAAFIKYLPSDHKKSVDQYYVKCKDKHKASSLLSGSL